MTVTKDEERRVKDEGRGMEEVGLELRGTDMELRMKGADHYKTGGVEPIDLLRDGGMLRDYALGCIIKYAFRNRQMLGQEIVRSDMEKIRHYAEILEEWRDEV